LFLDHHGGGQGRGHVLHQGDHVRPGFHRPIGKKEIDDDSRLCVRNLAQFVPHGADRIDAGLARGGQARLHLLGVMHAIPEHVGLESLNVREMLHKLEDRTVRGLGSGLLQPRGQGLPVAREVGRLAIRAETVGQGSQGTYVEGQLPAPFREQQHRAPGAHRMAQPQLVKHVGVRGRQVRYGKLTEDQALIHRLVDDPAGHLFIGPERVQLRGANGRRDELLVHAVEVHQRAPGARLLSKRHEDKTQGMGHSIYLPVTVEGQLVTF